MFLLDTNVAISALNETDPVLAGRLDTELALGSTLLISTIVLFELRYGVSNSSRQARNEAVLAHFLAMPFVIAHFEPEDAQHAADIRAYLRRIARPIGPYDLLIAGQARRRGAVLVTANRREFERVPGLMVQDWQVAQ